MLVPLLLLQLAATDVATGNVFHGRAGATDVTAPRLDAAVVVDGVLDEAVWSRAAVLTGFSQYRPIDGVAADDSTEVRVWYSADALYVGIRALEPHGVVNATLADRDAIFGDDNVQLLLDTFDDRRRALVFAMNPYGVQADGVRDESEQARSGFFDAEAAEGGILDLSPDFVFESRGRPSPDGYTIEVRIPFESLRFQSTELQTWGINVVREVQHAGQTQTWTAARRGETSFLAQSGRLVDLYALDRGLVLDVQPELTRQLAGARPGGAGAWNYADGGPELGVNARWGITPNLTMSATMNPDFSQVEADVAQVQFDPRQAIAFPEKRPFFLENSENFDVPGGLIHTRTIVDPLAAVKLAGKVAGTEVGVLSAVDDTAYSATGSHPVVNLLRVRRDLGDVSTLGLAWTDRIDGEDYNRVGSVDGKLVLGSHTLRLQAANSFSRAGGATTGGPLWDARVERSGREWGWSAQLRGIHDEFDPGSGFLSRTGVVYQSIMPRLTFYYEPGSLLESWSTAINFNNTWLYDRFTSGETRPDEAKVHFNNSFRLRGGWNLGAALLVESFLMPPDLYTDYAIERTLESGATDTVPFVGQPSIENFDLVLSVGTPQFQQFSASGFVLFGSDENFPEWAPGWLLWMESAAEWRPSERLRISPMYNETRVMRPDDWSVVTVTQIPRLKVEYQVARPVFVRLVGQYVARRQDALHDDSRTEDPILIRNASGEYRRALGFRSNGLRLDALFSYQPTPGTVVFAGYGTSLGATATGLEPRLRYDDLERMSDGFFLKVSYLFRI